MLPSVFGCLLYNLVKKYLSNEEIGNRLLRRIIIKSRLQFSRLGLFPFEFSLFPLRPKASGLLSTYSVS